MEGREPSKREEYVLGLLVDEFRKRQARKFLQYGDNNHEHLGVRGQFADIWRKIGPLKRALWEGEPTADWPEQPREILMDLIGHCLLTIELLDRSQTQPMPGIEALMAEKSDRPWRP